MNHSTPAIILAGGLGTRLRGVINDLPKPMALVNSKPFLHYLFVYLEKQKIESAVLSVGYKAEIVEKYFGSEYLGVKIIYSYEHEPLGTGGGMKKAFQHVSDFAFVLNGDTFFDVDLDVLKNFHHKNEADISLALKSLQNFDRYGTVQIQNERIVKFEEKKMVSEGLINGGVYYFSKKIVEETQGDKFSFETEVLEKSVTQKKVYGKIFENYFIDIGIPEDYQRAQADFKNQFL